MRKKDKSRYLDVCLWIADMHARAHRNKIYASGPIHVNTQNAVTENLREKEREREREIER
jgi:hypothetical protein